MKETNLVIIREFEIVYIKSRTATIFTYSLVEEALIINWFDYFHYYHHHENDN